MIAFYKKYKILYISIAKIKSKIFMNSDSFFIIMISRNAS